MGQILKTILFHLGRSNISNGMKKFDKSCLPCGRSFFIEKTDRVDKNNRKTQKTSRVSEAYIFAVQNPDMVKYIACYCGCGNMQDSDVLMTHKSLKDCYIKSDGSYEQHASECKLCNDITLQVRDMLMKGYSLKTIRKTVDDEYSGRGIGTNTSLPT